MYFHFCIQGDKDGYRDVTLPPPPQIVTEAGGCQEPRLKNDGHCDDGNNNPGCDYDGGDCCIDKEKKHCTLCECKDPHHIPGCGTPKWVGDTNCDDDNNNHECRYDGGDCCTDTRHLYCKECTCKEPNKSQPRDCPNPFYVGDGICDDENNIPECDYDLGDCCTDPHQKYCKECKCIDNAVYYPLY